jgi:hypothetical protein
MNRKSQMKQMILTLNKLVGTKLGGRFILGPQIHHGAFGAIFSA